jgi:cardiolipin synthase
MGFSAELTGLLFKLAIAGYICLVATGAYYVLTHPREPRAMLAWLLTFLLIPLLGVVLFFLLSDPKLNRRRRRAARRRRRMNPALWERLQQVRENYAADRRKIHPAPEIDRFIRLATRINNRQPPTVGNAITLYHDAAGQVLQAMLCEITRARHHVYLEYFIFKADSSGCDIAELLKTKARQGVKCRLLIDHLGSWSLPLSFTRELEQAGVEIAFFMSVIPWRTRRWRLRPNFRNHRKIAVIDGKIAFTGSQNVGDEYFGRDHRDHTWIDTQIAITGPAVYELQELFMEDWNFTTGVDLYSETYFPEPLIADDNDGSGQIVQIIPSGPDYRAQIMHHLLLAAISAAKSFISIATPYFVPDSAMMLSLQAAAYRDVNVRLLVPSRTDNAIALWAGRSYYQDLIDSGVHVYEYGEGFLHSKLVIIDRHWGMLGSANMDERSFRLNYEITTVLYTVSALESLQTAFNELMKVSLRIGRTDYRASRLQIARLGLARLFSPLY